MANLSLSEIVTIVVIILIVFGPERLPEMARKTGQFVRKARSMVTDLRQEYEEEWNEVAKPIQDVRRELMGMKTDLESSMASLNDDIARAKKELEEQLAEAKEEIESKLGEPETASSETQDDDAADAGDGSDG